MYKSFPKVDYCIMVAAVSDYKSKSILKKIKKEDIKTITID